MIEVGTLNAIMRLDDIIHDDHNEYLCHNGKEFFWSNCAPPHRVVHINAEHFTILARWYWETFQGETPLETWARRYNISYNQRIVEISYSIDNVVFCGCSIHPKKLWGSQVKIYESRYNHVMEDDEIYRWVQRLAKHGI